MPSAAVLPDPVFPRLAIIGIGLIGSSLARAAKAYGAAGEIVLFDADPRVREAASRLDLGRLVEDPRDAVEGADAVILCTPVGALGAAAAAMAEALKPGVIVTDVGSVKMRAIDLITPHLPDTAYFIPGHPIAGTEQSGPEAGFKDLFKGRWAILTPTDQARQGQEEALARLADFWARLGSQVELMDARRHDLVLAITSHVPHLIAFNIVSTAADLESVTQGEVVKFSAGGFRDFTRIAASDPVMWRDVFLNNKEAVLEVLARFNEDLSALARAIRWEDGEALKGVFTRARGIRRSIIEAGQDTSAVNFGRDSDAEDDDAPDKGPV
jgi:cyclohexadieny/prephenate dehydrogenase